MNTTLLFMGIGTQEFFISCFNHPAAVRRKEDSRTDERYWQRCKKFQGRHERSGR